MTRPTLHSPPRLVDVLREQVRAVALALRLPAIVAVVLMGIATALNLVDFLRGRGGVEFAPELSMIPGMVGMLLPIGIWRRAERIGNGFFWALPVDRRQHALTKVCAGWLCLMAAVLAFTLWLLALTVWTGGNILAPQDLQLLPAIAITNRALEAADLQMIRWKPEPLLWLVPFTAATGMYVLASAFALGTRYPLRWLIGVFLGGLLVSATGSATNVEWLKLAPSNLLDVVHQGRYGMDAMLTAKTESLKTVVTLSNGKTVGVWRALPDIKEWVVATLFWVALGVVMLWVAASRHRETRRNTIFNTVD